MSAPTEVRDRPLQPTISRAEEQAGIARANRFQARIEARAREEWASLVPIALEWLTDTRESHEFVQIIWLLENEETRADGRKRIEQMQEDWTAYRTNNYGIGTQLQIEREIAEEEE